MYVVCIKIDETLPWIELKRVYETRKEAKKAAEDFRRGLHMRIVSLPEKRQPIAAIASIKPKRHSSV